jgi:hypothetical protein
MAASSLAGDHDGVAKRATVVGCSFDASTHGGPCVLRTHVLAALAIVSSVVQPTAAASTSGSIVTLAIPVLAVLLRHRSRAPRFARAEGHANYPKGIMDKQRIDRLSRWRFWLGIGVSVSSTVALFAWSNLYMLVPVAVSGVGFMIPVIILDRKIARLGGPELFGRQQDPGGGRR